MTDSYTPGTACVCGTCGESFPSKAARRRHKQAGCTPASNFIGIGEGEPDDDGDLYGLHGAAWHQANAARILAEWVEVDRLREAGLLPVRGNG